MSTKKSQYKMPVVATDSKLTTIENEMQDGRILRFILASDVNGNPIVDIHVVGPNRVAVDFLGTIYCPTTRAFAPGDAEVPTGEVVTDIKVKLNKTYVGPVEEY